jgi:hypothetical protein
MANMPPAPLVTALGWIGFPAAESTAIADELGNSFEDLTQLSTKDIKNLASDFQSRTQQNGRIVVGLGRTKLIQAMVYWVKDCERANQIPSLAEMDQVSFIANIRIATERA